jgi:hypothetical protein
MTVFEAQSQQYKEAGTPCRNFNVLASAVINDPRDGREKLVLSNFAAGQTGNLIFIDTLTGEGESLELPGDDGAWGLVNWYDEKLVVGTCPNHAYLHCLDLRTREWTESLKVEGEKYFWDMTLGSDGNIYGGTWPGCSLICYDPIQHTLVNLGRVSDNPNNQYSRPVNGKLPGYILFAGGYDQPFLKAFHIESGTFRDFGTPGFVVKEVNENFICTFKGNDLEFYDPLTFERLDHSDELAEKLTGKQITFPNGKKIRAIPLSGGRWAGIRGQDYVIIDNLDEVPELKRIPVPAPATRIHTITVDAEGNIWGACGFGQTIFRFNPADGSYWNSSSVSDSGGEVYGMRFVEGKLFMSAYVGGDHIVYDPTQPWDQVNNVNPRALRSVSPDYVRPEGRTVIGPDGGLWTGWSAKYGTYGGALSRIQPDTLEVNVWKDQVEGQQVAGVAADQQFVYFTTNGGASGLPYQEVACHFGVWHPEKGLVHTVQLEAGVRTGNAILAVGGKVFVGVGNEIRVFNPELMAFEEQRTIPVEQQCSWLVATSQGEVGAFSGERLLLLEASSGIVKREVQLPGPVKAATEHPDGIYFAVESVLYKLEG